MVGAGVKPVVVRPISNLEFRIDPLMWIRPMVQHANLQIGLLDEWTNPHQGINSKFEVRNWTRLAG
jgi:hypothetical protein